MPQAQTANPLMNFAPLIFIFVIFYFMLIRPQRQREKQHQALLSNLNKNDEIVTNSGIHGTVVNVKEKSIILRVDDNVKIELDKNCVAYIKKTKTEEKGS